jgi:hypothetical protein
MLSGHPLLLWIRNPISRFVSAFNYAYAVSLIDVTKLDPREVSIKAHLDPGGIRRAIAAGKRRVFCDEYTDLLSYFGSPNSLAEGLSSNNEETSLKASRLMRFRAGHISRGIGWYLENGNLIERVQRRLLFVGRQEEMKIDLLLFSKRFDLDLILPSQRIRENQNRSCSKQLSALAVRNLKSFYADTDYEALRKLNQFGFVSDETLRSYMTYSD